MCYAGVTVIQDWGEESVRWWQEDDGQVSTHQEKKETFVHI